MYLGKLREMRDISTEDMRGSVYSKIHPSDVFTILSAYQAHRDDEYGRSWAKRGLVGYWAGCIGRSTDRIDGAFSKLMSTESDYRPEQRAAVDRAVAVLLDTLVDVCCYACMGICMIAHLYPEQWDRYAEDTLDDCAMEPTGANDMKQRVCDSVRDMLNEQAWDGSEPPTIKGIDTSK